MTEPAEPGTPADEKRDGHRTRSGFSRRSLFLGGAAGLVAGGAIGAGVTAGAAGFTTDVADDSDNIDLNRSYPFYSTASAVGAHPAGVQTEPQRYIVYMAFDLTSTLASDLQVLLARWSGAIAQMMGGHTIGQVQPAGAYAVGGDTGEALDLGPAGLTVTVGLGPGVFDTRFGLAEQRPSKLAVLPELPSDQLQSGISGGDVSLQACADDPQVAYHAIRNLARMAKGTATTRWTVLGFGRASAGANQQTPRNLMGFKDGTRNIKDEADYQKFVWASSGEPSWALGGTYQVVRKIQMNIENWDQDVIGDQQTVFGRSKSVGAPLTGHAEFDTPDFHAHAHGQPVISPTAHIALAAHENNGGVKLLRRSYNYTDGINQYGLLDAGLLFIAYMNTPEHFVKLQSKLGAVDRLNEYIAHIGSGIFYVPPAPRQGSYIGEALFRS